MDMKLASLTTSSIGSLATPPRTGRNTPGSSGSSPADAGREGLAALFSYQPRPTRLTWKAPCNFSIPDSVTKAWDEVARTSYGLKSAAVKQLLDGTAIKSHADSIVQLQLSQMVVRPISLQ
ncbi:unnamed protein product [Clonostachys byssicola]|uniref:DUF6546 domain-containing protein n=1 Tax=Clonostachys byssicola TaxID=160290 RepID=A0A9N9U927_9HYPO|nr:unnamed protein product [Clonostachys byssicola]